MWLFLREWSRLDVNHKFLLALSFWLACVHLTDFEKRHSCKSQAEIPNGTKCVHSFEFQAFRVLLRHVTQNNHVRSNVVGFFLRKFQGRHEMDVIVIIRKEKEGRKGIFPLIQRMTSNECDCDRS